MLQFCSPDKKELPCFVGVRLQGCVLNRNISTFSKSRFQDGEFSLEACLVRVSLNYNLNKIVLSPECRDPAVEPDRRVRQSNGQERRLWPCKANSH